MCTSRQWRQPRGHEPLPRASMHEKRGYFINYRPQRSWGKFMFLHVSVILFTGGGIPACLAGFQAHTRGGGELEGSGWGDVSRPTPKGEVEGSGLEGGVSRPTWVGRGVYPSIRLSINTGPLANGQ